MRKIEQHKRNIRHNKKRLCKKRRGKSFSWRQETEHSWDSNGRYIGKADGILPDGTLIYVKGNKVSYETTQLQMQNYK